MLLSVVHQLNGREESMLSETLPLVRCKKCGIGTMLPLSDYGQDGAAILYKAWVCDSPTCGHNLRISSKAASIRLRQWQGCAAVAFPPHAPDAVRTTRGVRCSPKQGRSRGRRSRVPS